MTNDQDPNSASLPAPEKPADRLPFERELQTPPDESAADPARLHLFYEPVGTLRLTVADDHSYPAVKLFQSAPLSRPREYLSLQNGKGEEILLLRTLGTLGDGSRVVAEEELRRRYLTACITEVTEIRTEFGVTYWQVETDRGARPFVIQNMGESCQWVSDDHLLLQDVDGNRFEIVSRAALPPASQAQLDSVL